MDSTDKIEARYRLKLPSDYLQLYEANRFTWFGVDKSPEYLSFTDLEWLTLDEIAEYKFLDQIDGLVPFAISARRDEWSWRTDWNTGSEPSVVFCGRVDTGYGYAPHFKGALYRLFLEELSGTWIYQDHGRHGTIQQFRKYLQFFETLFPERWIQTLQELLPPDARLRKLPRSIGVVSSDITDAIIARDLAFDHLNEVFEHYIRG